jgi:hypothetical protein
MDAMNFEQEITGDNRANGESSGLGAGCEETCSDPVLFVPVRLTPLPARSFGLQPASYAELSRFEHLLGVGRSMFAFMVSWSCGRSYPACGNELLG